MMVCPAAWLDISATAHAIPAKARRLGRRSLRNGDVDFLISSFLGVPGSSPQVEYLQVSGQKPPAIKGSVLTFDTSTPLKTAARPVRFTIAARSAAAVVSTAGPRQARPRACRIFLIALAAWRDFRPAAAPTPAKTHLLWWAGESRHGRLRCFTPKSGGRASGVGRLRRRVRR